ncbi:MAG: lactamase [Thermoflexus sp.]|uniref:MBL fold metallo-hydrolase n=1 Tax=Thermoflexus sp. TaxID=1969742 RepID=UPI00331908C0
MEIAWFGLSCFRIRSRTATIVTDPYDKSVGLSLPRLKADIVTVSHDAPGHNAVRAVRGEPRVISGPGEYEIGGVFITGLEIRPEGKRKRDRARRNTIFVFELEDMRVCHLGDLQHVPSQAEVEEALGEVDVLLIPVGDGEALNAAQAAEVVRRLEPRLVIPMHYRVPGLSLRLDPVQKFLKEMGSEKAPTLDVLKISRSDLPEETQVVVLHLQAQEEG